MALCLLLTCLPGTKALGGFSPRLDSGSCGPDATYKVVDGVLTISGTGAVTARSDQYPLSVTSLVIEEGITSLGDGAFSMMQLTQVEIPDSVTRIGYATFFNTPWLENQTDEFFIVGSGVLLDYNGPGGAVVIPDTVRSIAGHAFFQADITAVTIGNTVEDIGSVAFSECSRLETVSIADSVTWVASNAFDETPWLEAQEDEYVVVGNGALITYKGLDDVLVIPDTVRTIPSYALSPLRDGTLLQIKEITIPATVTGIQRGAFIGGGAVHGVINVPPVIVHGARGSAAEQFCREHDLSSSLVRFIPFGQEDGSLFNFITLNEYSYPQFKDVDKDVWYHENVARVYKAGLMKGISENYFNPGGNIKLSEAVAVAARVRDIYYYGQTDFTASGTWYQPYADYALAHGIIAEAPDNWERAATRAEFASMLAAALPERELEASHEELAFTDIDGTHPHYEAVMVLVRAGVMQGKGEGRFDPDAQVKRSEAAAMLCRCIRPEQRIGIG